MKLPNFLFKRVKEHKTSLGNNEAFPPEEDYPFDYKILKDRYNDVVENIKVYSDIESLDENYLISLLNNLITQCKEKEKPLKEQLEKLCKKIVSETFRIPNETITLNITLTDKLEPTQKYQLTPQTSNERSFDFDDLEDFNNAEKSILKRRLINSLIQGASYEYMTKCVMHLDEITTLLSDLKPIYERIIAINDFLLFNKEESITDEKMHQGAIVEVMLGRGGDKTEINVQGLVFPFLLNETFRGMFELFASHGLPKDLDKANYILTHSEFLLAEPWDLRFGVNLWKIVSDNVYGYESMPYFFMTLCEMPVEEFNANMKEVFAKTKRGKQFVIDLNEFALKESEFESDIEPLIIQDETDDLITDAYISSDGLDSYYLSDENGDQLNDVIEENNSPDSVELNGNFYHNTDNDAVAFMVDKDYNLYLSKLGGVHIEIMNDVASRMMGFESYVEYKNEIRNLSYEKREDYEYELDKYTNDFLKTIPYQGRFWINDEIIVFWYITPSTEKMDIILNELSQELNITLSNPKIIIGDNVISYNEYNSFEDINNDMYKNNNSKSDNELRNIHLMNQKDKSNALKDFKNSRGELQGNKLGKMTMAQYHNLLNQESINNVKKVYINESQLQLLREGLYDNFDVRDIDVIYFNSYQEDWGDEEEPDIQDLYNIIIYNMDGNVIYENDGLTYDELDELLGNEIAFKIYMNDCEINRNPQLSEYYPYRLNYINSHEFGDANETAKQIYKNQLTEYYPNLHGYIMEDGLCIDLGGDDHNSICKVPQIDDKWEFIALGNIRCSNSFFDLIKEPTREQKYALRKLIANANDLSVDIFSEDSDSPITSAIYYESPNPSYVLGEIDRFFNEGINLRGGYSEDNDYMYESKEYLTESDIDNMNASEDGGDGNNKDEEYLKLLTSCSENDIDFREEEYNLFNIPISHGMWILHVIINGVEIPTNYVFFRAEEESKINSYQLHINIDERIRRQGVAFKLYQAFIRIFGTACSYFKNRTASFYSDKNASNEADAAIDGLWKKIISLPNVNASYLVNRLRKKIGVKVTLKQ